MNVGSNPFVPQLFENIQGLATRDKRPTPIIPFKVKWSDLSVHITETQDRRGLMLVLLVSFED
jgi:hypothetical protein